MKKENILGDSGRVFDSWTGVCPAVCDLGSEQEFSESQLLYLEKNYKNSLSFPRRIQNKENVLFKLGTPQETLWRIICHVLLLSLMTETDRSGAWWLVPLAWKELGDGGRVGAGVQQRHFAKSGVTLPGA